MMYYSSSWKVLLTLSAIIVLAAQLVSIAAQDPELDFYNFQTGHEDHHTLQARQAVAQEEGASETDAQKPEDQAAKQLIEMILDTSAVLDVVTSMGSNATIVKLAADAVIKMLPEVNTARENLLKIVNKQSQDQDNAKRITAANDNSTKILKDIIAKPEDTNFIKENYPALKAGFDELFNAYGSTLNLALPVAAKELEAKKPKESSDKSDKTPPK
ncbi:hypothetical protein Pst134EA_006819 [Puccinia striiformis f. sp. tritici]|uniref:uncharacterized protein n=1 Tax=Puccinia striiformis f. sp. tritici TaxID=168172 RepID=UPI00200745A2|nr:uncharacterized protein Pst134EA_032010 [Puccinia striiformis f. sp. tritici]XP_047808978.1 hypothetical protein Pst134EA_006819 [Puccinia striiformis f. sp. tritici]KAH9441967.1 hypothetical protein Pst134EA_032010 [Puccinia striiformis f. sp. tritici]KAH9469524.1 hypothetical protein Pst134EA_006819 [Puccinia striiformis f. sp. tritici]